MAKEYNEPCKENCLNHKYHCAKCNTALSYSPQNFASRPDDIIHWCEKCNNFEPQEVKEDNYAHLSHSHCWNNQPSPCGIPLEKHTQCCLCDLPVPLKDVKTDWEKEFDEKYHIDNIVEYSEQIIPNDMKKSPIKQFISSSIATAVKRAREEERERCKNNKDE